MGNHKRKHGGSLWAASYPARKVAKTLHVLYKNRHKTKSKGGEGGASSTEHSVLGTKYYKIVLGKRPKGETLTSWDYHETQRVFASGGSGFQQVNRLFSWLTKDQILTSTGASYTQDQGYQSLVGLNMNQFNSGGAATLGLSLAAGQVPYTDRFLVKSIDAVVNITNRLNISTYCTLYLVRYKRDTGTNSTTHWSNGCKDMAASSAATSMTFLASPAFNAVGGADASGHVGAHPTAVREFNDFMKVVHRHSFVLPGGGSERIHYKIILNKLIKHEIPALQGTTFVGGISYELFVVGNGTVIYDSSAAKPTYGTTSLIAICETHYKCCSLSGAANRMQLNYGVTNVPTDTAGANSKIITDIDALGTVIEAI